MEKIVIKMRMKERTIDKSFPHRVPGIKLTGKKEYR